MYNFFKVNKLFTQTRMALFTQFTGKKMAKFSNCIE